jgi:hypothetical protein
VEPMWTAEEERLLRATRAPLLGDGRDHVLVRFVLLRLLGLVYLVAFLVAARQNVALIGPDGLEPADTMLSSLIVRSGSRWAAFVALPTLFVWTGASAAALSAVAWAGVVVSALVLLGVENAVVNLVLWALYLSIVQVGQTFYGFGWEAQLLETGLLAVFLCPAATLRPMAKAPPMVTIVAFRWLIVRIMLGAGLIKLRGDPCWRDLTCLVYHYETQPVPNPLSCVLDGMPRWFHQTGVLANHVVELAAPLFAFGPRRLRLVAGSLFIGFQCTLIASGNLSFLNWMTLVPAIACLDDRALRSLVPERIAARLPRLRSWLAELPGLADTSRPHRIAAWAWGAVVAALSLPVVWNLMSPGQAMNRSFDRLHLVNTYGAFGSVGKVRHELIIEGTSARDLDESTRWQAYELPCKPGDPGRRPCVISPYHHRLDWQIWFAAMSQPGRQPWLVHLVAMLLGGEPVVKPLLARDPFPTDPPVFVRIQRYRYDFHHPCGGGGAWWDRTLVGTWLPPLHRDDPRLLDFLATHGWPPP